MSTKINQLDLFSGIGGFHLGFERAGFEVTSYFSEIDKHAVAVYQHKFKDATYVGSVTDVRGADLPNIDLITFGSPCQDFSLAGKRKGMDGERSSLILEAIRLITECRPRAFVWENVKGTFSSNDGADFAAILQEFTNIGGYRLEWQLLNTSWFLPQNRERIYLVGYSTAPTGDWGGVFPIRRAGTENNESPSQEIGKDITHTICSSYSKFSNDSPVVFDNYNYKWRDDGNVGTLTSHSGRLHEGFKIKEIGDYRNDEGWRPRKDGLSPCLATRRHSEVDISNTPPLLKQEIGDYRSDEGWRPRKDGNCPTLAARARQDGSGQPILKEVVQPKMIGYTRDAQGKVTDRHLKDYAGTIHTASGQGGNTDQFIKQPNYEIIKQKVWVRKHEVDIEGLQNLLRSHKNKTNKQIADALNQPITKVEHWFRKDKAGFSIPEAEVWYDLKKLLGISLTDYDAQVTEFVEQDGKYDQAERVYNKEGLAPTLTLAQEVKIKDTPHYRIRRLTPIECERLQGFPDDHTQYGNYDGEVKEMSNTQRYKQCGNAVTVDVVKAVAEQLIPIFNA